MEVALSRCQIEKGLNDCGSAVRLCLGKGGRLVQEAEIEREGGREADKAGRES
jgi:hypothetical protein